LKYWKEVEELVVVQHAEGRTHVRWEYFHDFLDVFVGPHFLVVVLLAVEDFHQVHEVVINIEFLLQICKELKLLLVCGLNVEDVGKIAAQLTQQV
jgi:hypothetical protein